MTYNTRLDILLCAPCGARVAAHCVTRGRSTSPIMFGVADAGHNLRCDVALGNGSAPGLGRVTSAIMRREGNSRVPIGPVQISTELAAAHQMIGVEFAGDAR